jgi:hypothetical protein
LLIKVPATLTAAQRQHLEAFLRFCPQAYALRKTGSAISRAAVVAASH